MADQYTEIVKAIVDGDDTQATKLVEAALAQGLPPLDILNLGVVAGINQTGELWAANKYFLPDVILSADAFKAAMLPSSLGSRPAAAVSPLIGSSSAWSKGTCTTWARAW